MLNTKTILGIALLAPLLGVAGRGSKMDAEAAHAECFRQANAAVPAQGFSANTADKNAAGLDAYRQCCFKAGIKP
jgi:hypothetical protein